MVLTWIENPRVGGSIPPQATRIHAPPHPIRVRGVSTYALLFLQLLSKGGLMAATQFFAREDTKLLVAQAASALANLASGDPKKKLLQEVLKILASNTEQFDADSATNIEWVGGSISDALANVAKNPKNDGAIDTLYALLYRCVIELELSMKADLSMELRGFKQYCRDNRSSFIADAQQQFAFAEQAMPIAILKRLINSDDIQKLKDTKTFSGQVDAKMAEWEANLTNRESRVQEVADELRKYEHAFNFVGLHQGFDDLSRAKRRELRWLRGLVVFLGLIALGPLAAESIFIYSHFSNIDAVRWSFAASALPVLSLTIILLYFFRLAIRSADGAKSQLLQIELRKTLCRFIQSYADYIKRFKAEGGESLAKFENVIFSAIVGSDEKIPATFDGVNQISTLVKAVKSP
jgi:hypothetical protein